jgi:hypothetical protein
MAISILQNATAVAPNGLTVPFSGTGGTAPYQYAVLSGGVGGSINSSGIYTSPSGTGVDTIQVTDSLGAKATTEILVANALELFCDIIQNQMGLAQGRVFLWNQKQFVPTDQGLWIPIAILSCKPYSNTRVIQGLSPTGMNQVQSVNMQALVDLHAVSRGPEARDQKELIIMALKSIYAQQQQELNSFYIAPITTGFTSISHLEGAAIPYRFSMTLMIQYVVTQTSAIPYYSSFSIPGASSIYTN